MLKHEFLVINLAVARNTFLLSDMYIDFVKLVLSTT